MTPDEAVSALIANNSTEALALITVLLERKILPPSVLPDLLRTTDRDEWTRLLRAALHLSFPKQL